LHRPRASAVRALHSPEIAQRCLCYVVCRLAVLEFPALLTVSRALAKRNAPGRLQAEFATGIYFYRCCAYAGSNSSSRTRPARTPPRAAPPPRVHHRSQNVAHFRNSGKQGVLCLKDLPPIKFCSNDPLFQNVRYMTFQRKEPKVSSIRLHTVVREGLRGDNAGHSPGWCPWQGIGRQGCFILCSSVCVVCCW
jgi:hypothetical protein